MQGSYVRVGDADQPMTEYEIYNYEAFRRKYQDDIRPVEQAGWNTLNKDSLEQYLIKLKAERPNLSIQKTEELCELVGLTREGTPTLAAVLLFSLFPQGYFPQLCITAVSVPGTGVGQLGPEGERFLDNRRIEGTLPEILEEALAFVRKISGSKPSSTRKPESGSTGRTIP